jgi:hypothetical protein
VRCQDLAGGGIDRHHSPTASGLGFALDDVTGAGAHGSADDDRVVLNVLPGQPDEFAVAQAGDEDKVEEGVEPVLLGDLDHASDLCAGVQIVASRGSGLLLPRAVDRVAGEDLPPHGLVEGDVEHRAHVVRRRRAHLLRDVVEEALEDAWA